jgi:CheY-like chemotaxis protein
MKKKKIMIVDDNPDLLYMIKKNLQRLDDQFEIIDVKSGKECIEHLKNHEMPDLILLDIMMPEMNGWNVLAKIRNETAWKKVPVVFLTAKDDSMSRGLGIITSDGYITKPFIMGNLKEKIDKILKERYR